jgi:4-hydroxy-3-methylbut-2-enyl diphosphate reductase
VSAAIIAAPLRVEWLAVRRAQTTVVHTGMGRRRSLRAAARRLDGAAVLVAGVAGGLAGHLRVGDLVVASEIRDPEGTTRTCPAASALAEDLRRLGLAVHCGPIVSYPRLVDGAGRHRLAATGALAVDMESAWLAPPDPARFAVVRAISDTAAAPVLSPAIVRNGLAALRALRRAVPALDAWALTGAMEVT